MDSGQHRNTEFEAILDIILIQSELYFSLLKRPRPSPSIVSGFLFKFEHEHTRIEVKSGNEAIFLQYFAV